MFIRIAAASAGTPAGAASTVVTVSGASAGDPCGTRESSVRYGVSGTNVPDGSPAPPAPVNQPSRSTWKWAGTLAKMLACPAAPPSSRTIASAVALRCES